jgi:hypothetical protein
VAAKDLLKGDLLRRKDGSVAVVEEVFDTGVEETVYNCSVADYHTYFVGGEDWGFSVWAHNDCVLSIYRGNLASNGTVQTVANEIRRAVQRAERTLGNLSPKLIRSSRRVALYNDLLQAQRTGNMASLSQGAKDMVTKFGLNGAIAIARGSAIQSIANNILIRSQRIGPLILARRLILDRGSQLELRSSRGNLLRPDFQLRLGNGRWAIFDITTVGQLGKISKYRHRRAPFLIEILYGQ